MIAPADVALLPIAANDEGFDATGAAVTVARTLYTTKLLRLPYPDQVTLEGDEVALSDFVYATTTIAGLTNSSTLASPKPIAHWVSTDRDIVGDSVTPEIVAFHRNGVACVIFRATDGVTTVTATASAPVVSGRAGDRNAVLVWRAALDLSTLADNADITVNAKVYPRIGKNTDESCVRDSASGVNFWQFSPRTWRRNAARAAAPPIVYVASGGNDTTGYVGTDDGLAAASPCLTLTGAFDRARTVLGTTAGSLDGLRVRLTAGTWARASSPTSNTVNAHVTLEPGTGVAKADAVFEFGAATNTFGVSYIRHRGLTVRRMGAFYAFSGSAGYCLFEDCDLDFNTFNGALASGTAPFFFNGVGFTGLGTGSALQAGAPPIAMLRGCSFGTANSNTQIEPNLILGCDIRGCRTANGTRDISGGVIAFNTWLQAAGAGSTLSINQSLGPIDGFAVVQNVIEWNSATSNAALAPANDGGSVSSSHVIVWHNTIAGFDIYGRSNILYNDHATIARSHTLASFVGNIHVQINTKHDVFVADGTRTGGWAYLYGVGSRGEFSRYQDAGGGTWKQDYPGLGASIGTIRTGNGNDPLFTTYAGTTSAPAAGAGLGTYTLQAGSPARGIVTSAPLPFDLAGNARAATAAAGAYA